MLKHPTKHPEIVLRPNNSSIAAYCAMVNYIEFNSPYIDESDIECILIHELCHWAQYMFLEEEDMVNTCIPQYEDDITEKMAYEISGIPTNSRINNTRVI